MNLCISQALLCKTTYCEFNKYILSACVFSGNEPMALALIEQCSTSWVKCQEFGFICSLTMSSGWNEVSHSLSNIPNCQEKNVTFLYTWFSVMSIACTDCAHYKKELDYKSQKYYVIFQLTGGMVTKLHFKSNLHKNLKGRKIYPVSDVGRHLCCCLGYHFFKMTKCLICGLMVSVTCVNILTHSAHLGELYLNPLSSVLLICRWHEFLFLSFPHRPLCFLLSTESNKDKNDGVLHNG